MTELRTSLSDPQLNWTDPDLPGFVPHRAVASPDGGYCVEITTVETEERAAAAAAWAAAAPARALDVLAAKRYAVMTGGIAVPAPVGFSISTTDAARNNISQVKQAIDANLAPDTIPWRDLGATHLITQAQAQAIFAAVVVHVAACFANEATLAGTIAGAQDPATVDITTGWPANG